MINFPQLSYPLSRSFPWPLFTPVVALAAFTSIMVLIPLNGDPPFSTLSMEPNNLSIVALTGYQVIQTPRKDFNYTDPHWWNKFAPHHKPGTLCLPQNYSTGNIIGSTYSLFQWNIISPNTSDLAAPSVEYKGANLDSCDVQSMGIDANILTPAISTYATIRCDDPEVPLLMRTSWSGWGSDSTYESQAARVQGDRTHRTGQAATRRSTTFASGVASGLESINEM
jgi:hypothetical protein